MATVSQITGRIVLPDNSAPVDGVIRFAMSGFDTDEADVVAFSDVSFPLDANGDLPAECVIYQNSEGLRGTVHRVSVIHAYVEGRGVYRREIPLGTIQINTAGPHLLSTLLNAGAPTVPGSWGIAITKEQYDAAIEAADRAEAAIAAMVNEFRTELMSVGHGTEAKPSLRFSGLDSGGAISTDANTGFFAHSDHTPALTVDGEEKLHFHASMLLPENGYVIANTATIAQLITYAAAGDFDTLPDNSVVWAGGYPFAKRAGAAYTGLPVGFVPSGVPTPMHFGAVGDGVTDDYAALAALAAWLAAGDWSEIMVSGRGLSFATSQTLTMSQINSVQFVNGQIIAIGSAGSWANTHSDVTAYFSGIQTVTADSKTWVERNPVVVFDRCVMEWGWDISGGGVAAGARAKNASGKSGAVILRDIQVVDFKTYGTLSLYGHGKLHLDGVTVRQVASGAEYLADRTGYGIAYDNIDTDIVGCKSQWSHCPLLTTGGTLFISNCDIFNGAGNNRYDEIAGTAPTYADLPPSVLFPDSPQNREIWYVTADDLYYQYSVDDGWVVTAVNLPTADVRLWEHRGNSTINWNGGRIGNGQIHNWAAGGGLTINGAKVGYTGTNVSSVWMKCYAVQANQKLGSLSIGDVQWPWELLNGDVPLFSLELDADYPAGSWSTEIDQAFLEALYGNVEVYSNNSKVVSLNGNDRIVTFVGVGAGAKAVFTDKATTVKVSVGVTGNDLELLGARTVTMTSGFGDFEAILSELGAFRPKMATTMTLGTPAAPWANVYANSVKMVGTTVAALPSPATAGAGARGFVTDATAPTFGAIVVGGGTVKTPVYSDGIKWRVG